MDGALDLSSKGNQPSSGSTSPGPDGSNSCTVISPCTSKKEDREVVTSDEFSEDNTPTTKPRLPPNMVNPLLGHMPPFPLPADIANYMDITKVGSNHKNPIVNSLVAGQTFPAGFGMYPMEPTLAATAGMYNPLAAATAMGMAGLGFPFPLGPTSGGGLPLPQTMMTGSANSITPSPISQSLHHKKRKRKSTTNHTESTVVSEHRNNTGQCHVKDYNNSISATMPSPDRTIVSDNRVSTSDVTSGSIFSGSEKTSMMYDEAQNPVERRRKNNEAAKRSRDTRRIKEAEIALRAALLEEENLKLKAQVAVLKNETSKLHVMLYQM